VCSLAVCHSCATTSVWRPFTPLQPTTWTWEPCCFCKPWLRLVHVPAQCVVNPLPRVFVSVCPHIRWRWRCSSSPQLHVRSASCCQLVCVYECAPRISRRCATCPSSQASSASSTAAACFPLVTTARRCTPLWVVPLGSCPARIAMEGAPR
jgi:hypothetical protein